MPETAQLAIPGAAEFEKPPAIMRLIEVAVEKGAGIDTVERLVALQERMMAWQAQIEFRQALNRVQSKIKRIAPDLENPQTRSKYASYAAIDRIVRPIYSEDGFSLSFTERDCPKPDHIRLVCFVDRGAHTREYWKDMPADGKGAKGNDVMSKTHAAGAADSYAKRYIVKNIFNISIGEDDNDGNDGGLANLLEHLDWIANCRNTEELLKFYNAAKAAAREAKDSEAMKKIVAAKDKRKAELQ